MQSIQFKRTQTAGKKPTPEQLAQGEVAINLADHVIYTKDKNNNVVQISVSPEKHAELNTKVDTNKVNTDKVISANKTEAANNLAAAKSELNNTITTKDTATNKRIDATNTTVSNLTKTVNDNKTDADTKINNLSGTVSANKTAIERTVVANKSDADSKHAALSKTVADNNTAINNKVNTTNTNVSNLTKTVNDNKTDADTKINNLSGTVSANKTAIEKTVSDNKKDADTKITNLTNTVNSNHTAIERTVANNKTDADAAIAAANRRIDGIEGSADAAYIKKNTNTYHGAYLYSKTGNYLEDSTARDLNYFGAFRTNGQDGFRDLTLNVPHSSGKQHGRGFTFQYGHSGSRVETYGFNANGERAFSYKVYHEGDKPTPSEIGAYTRAEVDQLFVKQVNMSAGTNDAGYFKIATATIPQAGRSCYLRIHGGNGYNVNSPDQCDIVEIVVRSGNGNPKGVNVVAYRRNGKNDFETFAVNTSGDNYDIYVKYRKYTDKVIVEYGKSADVTISVYFTPELTLVKPTTGVNEGRVITLFNTENKRGTLYFDDNTQQTYDIVSLSNRNENGKKYLRKFRSKSGHTIWHETVEGSTYRLATGTSDSSEVVRFTDRVMYTGKAVLDGGSIRLERQTGNSNAVEYWDRRNGANARQSWIGFGNADTNAFQIYSDAGKNNFALEQSGQISLNVGATKIVHTNGQYISTNADAYRMIYGNYGAFWRNDGVKTYLLSTAENDKWGSWTGNRPFIYEFSSGNVNLGGDSNKSALTLEGASKAARFGGHVYTGGNLHNTGQYFTMEAGLAGQSMDYIRFNHWGDSSNGRNNILYVEDSKGRHFSTERAYNGGLKANFLGDLEVGGKFTWGKGTGQSSFNCRVWGNDTRKQVLEWGDENGWHFYTQRAGGPGTTAIDFSVNGTVKAPNMSVSTKITTAQMSGFGVNVANILGGNSIVLGDSDTGFKQNGDGILDVYANNVAVMRFTSGAITANKAVNVTGRVTPTDYGNFDGRYIKKSKNRTRVWSGTLTGNTQTGTLSQDLRYRNVWILDAAGFNHFIRFGPDSNYYLAGNGGWIKIQLHTSGKIFKNIQDSNFVPKEIWVEDE
ncbi:tail fiber domain-containing protein [Shigella sonnei]|nr:tail fiber domain-containing protein [Shigella sonnei]EJQ1914283.1 tail fiber domain-containing protein [Escherichia coli]EIR2052313.1 tail fiber domain-containing protein [Shigella sonnei]EJB4295350.1 tail fiber domain-containing protein [Shigella sonnei]EJF5745475.1 tail fiber domain-containing protein [Shigella sonnei]